MKQSIRNYDAYIYIYSNTIEIDDDVYEWPHNEWMIANNALNQMIDDVPIFRCDGANGRWLIDSFNVWREAFIK